jgi:hypothetical protein
MRFLVLVLSPLAGLWLFTSAIPVVAQNESKADFSQNTRRMWSSLAQGRTEFQVLDPALVPSELALAAKQSGCLYEEMNQMIPVRFVEAKGRRFASMFCPGHIGGSDIMFDLSNRRPTLVEFPVLAHPDGFGTTASPGRITWDNKAGTFQTEPSHGDVLRARDIRLRHTYRLNDVQAPYSSPFVIVRVEAQQIPGPDQWSEIWEATRWSFLAPAK